MSASKEASASWCSGGIAHHHGLLKHSGPMTVGNQTGTPPLGFCDQQALFNCPLAPTASAYLYPCDSIQVRRNALRASISNWFAVSGGRTPPATNSRRKSAPTDDVASISHCANFFSVPLTLEHPTSAKITKTDHSLIAVSPQDRASCERDRSRIGLTFSFSAGGASQNVAQSSISRPRFSKRSPRR